MNQEEYEQDLKKRQAEHLKNVSNFQQANWQPCLHDQCSSCHGTGVKLTGGPCIHYLSCSCSKCSPQCLTSAVIHKAEITNMYNSLKQKVEIPFRHAKIVDWDDIEDVFKTHL